MSEGDDSPVAVVPQPKRLLVVRLGAIGDCLRVMPSVRILRRRFPEATIGWAVGDLALPLLEGHPAVDRLHVVRRREMKGGPWQALRELRRIGVELREVGYDVAVDFHTRWKSGVLVQRCGAPHRIGLDRVSGTEGNFLFTNHHVSLSDRYENRVLGFARMLAPLGIDERPGADDLRPWIEPSALARGRRLHAEAGSPPVVLVAGTSAHRANDRWPVAKWVELAGRLGAEGVRMLVLWGPGEIETAQAVACASPMAELAPPTTLPEMMAVCGSARLYVGTNTAAMHMAWMQGVPCVVLAGGRPWRTDRPLEPVASEMLSAGGIEPTRKLRGDAARRAIEEIDPEDAAAAALRLLR
jgi:heptosyltransferase-1